MSQKEPSASSSETESEHAGRATDTGAKAAAPAPGRRRGGAWGASLAVLALLVAGAAAAGAVYLYERVRGLEQQLDSRHQEAMAGVQNVRDALKAGLQPLTEARQNMEADQQQLRQGLQRLREQLGRDSSQWALAEVEYLLVVANERLQLAGDVEAASSALERADQRLRRLGDPALTELRARIAKELAALEAVPRPDIAGLVARLDGVAARIDALPLAAARPPSARGKTQTGESADGGGWRGAVGGLWSELKTLVVIRRHDKPITPMLSPAQARLLRQVLRLRLEGARTALLARDTALFRASLKGGRRWLAEHFDSEDSGVRAAADTLRELAGTPLRPSLPDISGSLNWLRSHRESGAGSLPHPAAGSPATL